MPTILSRFDMIYIVKDTHDVKLAFAIMISSFLLLIICFCFLNLNAKPFVQEKASLSLSDGSFERAAVLFNCGALMSQIAAAQPLITDEELKTAAKLFQQSAGVFARLRDTILGMVQQDPTPDLMPDTLASLSAIMVAQAQESIYVKAYRDGYKMVIHYHYNFYWYMPIILFKHPFIFDLGVAFPYYGKNARIPSCCSDSPSRNMFSTLVPVQVHNAIQAYEGRKAELVNIEMGRLREHTQLMNGFVPIYSILASLNLPAALDDVTSSEILPESIKQKSTKVCEVGKYRGILHTASNADKMVKDKFEVNMKGIEMLSKSEIWVMLKIITIEANLFYRRS
uniref:BRO1 domain-containing protein n=1 Tax=Heterorhabditis bacteriophora TaxID=37862 RepID=A0A1I7X4Z8_HETBA